MNEIAKRWTAALRSGEYQQTTDSLRSELEDGQKGFCCLGVLCDLSGLGTWELYSGAWHYTIRAEDGSVVERSDTELPALVREWSGIREPSGTWWENNGSKSLAAMNDRGDKFVDLADTIEAKWNQLTEE